MQYVPHAHHRSAAFANQKSQWCISIAEEQGAYAYAVQQSWALNNIVWGLHLVQAIPEVLGTSPPDHYNVKIAKFVGDAGDNWHGYPVAHWLSPFDKPGLQILERWRETGLINQSTLARIYRGKRCNL